MDGKIKKIIESCKSDEVIYQLGSYLMTGEPIYLPKEVRYIDNQIDREELFDWLAKLLVERSKN